MTARHVLVVDVGKTNAKLALVDTEALAEVEVMTRPNPVLPGPPYPHADVEGLWDFMLGGIGELHRRHRVDALVVTTHGATGALVDADGGLALPVLDYEHPGPDELAAAYDAVRPGFAATGSPRLPAGLNLGAQLFWQFARFPEAARTAAILTYPQYWASRLSGVLAVEPTSLGCHTDLWDPRRRDFSALVERQGWRRLMPTVRLAGDVLGPVTAAVAAATGLPPDTPVLCGIHDSNASLLPHLRARPAPFAVVSTGTWVVSMAVGAAAKPLDPARDTLLNVNADGDPVPSARFMGGRERAIVMDGRPGAAAPADRAAVLARGICLLPAVEPGSGPFAGRTAGWSVPERDVGVGERAIAVSWYLAMMTSVGLAEIGAQGPTVVEGPFATNGDFTAMLAAATGRPVAATPGGTGTSVGAALLAAPSRRPRVDGARVPPDATLAGYAARWHALVAAG
ncbi:MAG: FGGY-family carbohydrate kinase [Amaricoccus sp.]